MTTIDYQMILERVSDGFIALDMELRYIYANNAACQYLKRHRDELIGKKITEVFPDSKHLAFIAKYKQALQTGEIMQWEEFLPPYSRWFYNIVYPNNQGLSVFFKDISEQKSNEAETLISNERFELASLATDDVIWDWNLITNEIWWNIRFREIFLYDQSEIESDINSWKLRIHPDDRDRTIKGIYDCIDQKKKFWSDEYRFRKRDGNYAYLYDRGYIMYNENQQPIRMIGAMMDITERKKSEIALHHLNEQLKQYSSKLQKAIEDERTRIAHEIHDELGQQITLIKLDINAINSSCTDKQARKEYQKVLSSIDILVKSLQRIASDLRPTMLDDLGFKATVEWYAKEFSKRTKIKCYFSGNVSEELLSKNLSISLFRIIQEALTNCARHSNATEILIEFHVLKNEILQLKITDNGNGFNTKENLNTTSLGLVGMQERARSVGAQLSISSVKQKGTRIKVQVPIKIHVHEKN